MKVIFVKRRHLHFIISLLLLTISSLKNELGCLADTEVGGPLPTGQITTWSPAEGPYRLVQNVEVPASATLRIEPGVTILVGQYSLVIHGTLHAKGTSREPIVFTLDRTSPKIERWGNILFSNLSQPAEVNSDGQYLAGCMMEYTTVEFGQGIIIDRASPIFRSCLFRENQKAEGGAILSNYGSPQIRNCLITRNRAERHGGGIRTIGGHPVISHCEISYNTAARGSGGGICSDFSQPEITNNHIGHNMANEGGGIATGIPHEAYLSTAAHSQPIIAGNRITHNFALLAGAGVYVAGTPVIKNNTISNNCLHFGLATARELKVQSRSFADRINTQHHVGAGLYVEKTFAGPALIEANQFIHNSGAEWGGGIHLSRGSATVVSNLFVANQAFAGGGGVTMVFVREHESPGSRRHGTQSQFTGNEFVNNTAGAIEFAGNAKHDCVLESCVFQSNSPLELINHSTNDVPCSHCQFEKTDPLELQKLVFDKYDRLACGKLNLLEAASTDSSPSSPSSNQWNQFIACLSPGKLEASNSILNIPDTHDVVLQWEPLDHPDVSGYFVYFVEGDLALRAPFGYGSDAAEGHSPIRVGTVSSTRITGLHAGRTYHFAVSAYDQHGNESGYSNIATVRVAAQ